jgi:hypothetical protein
MYRLMGRIHAELYRAYGHMSAERGQGTVEYVALVLLIAGVFAVVVGAAKTQDGGGIATRITKAIKDQIDAVGGGSSIPASKN